MEREMSIKFIDLYAPKHLDTSQLNHAQIQVRITLSKWRKHFQRQTRENRSSGYFSWCSVVYAANTN